MRGFHQFYTEIPPQLMEEEEERNVCEEEGEKEMTVEKNKSVDLERSVGCVCCCVSLALNYSHLSYFE